MIFIILMTHSIVSFIVSVFTELELKQKDILASTRPSMFEALGVVYVTDFRIMKVAL